MNREIIAIIPARSGSKGIPDKNVREIGGRPLMAWAIHACSKVPLIDRVLVSTDSPEYQKIAEGAGAEVPFLRPISLSGDDCSSESALLHALDWLEENEGKVPNVLVFVQCTSPLLDPGDLEAAIEKHMEGKSGATFAMSASHRFLWRMGANGMEGVNHDHQLPRRRRQDLAPEYVETGSFYILDVEKFRKQKHRFIEPVSGHEVEAWKSFEIDDLWDWELCEKLLRQKRKESAPIDWSRIRTIAFDFDGVFTDNRVWTDETGRESVTCSRSDWLRFGEFRDARPDVECVIVSKEQNPVVQARASKLNIEAINGVDDKAAVLESWMSERNLGWDTAVFVGNDINDSECIQRASLGVCPMDAYEEVKEVSDLVLNRNGGQGAVRELFDLILKESEYADK